jgi:hypothetical protein
VDLVERPRAVEFDVVEQTVERESVPPCTTNRLLRARAVHDLVLRIVDDSVSEQRPQPVKDGVGQILLSARRQEQDAWRVGHNQAFVSGADSSDPAPRASDESLNRAGASHRWFAAVACLQSILIELSEVISELVGYLDRRRVA